MPRRRFALASQIRLGDRILMVDNPEDGLRWRPGTETSYYQVCSQPERKIMEIDHPGIGPVPRDTWWMTVERDATPGDPAVWSDGVTHNGRVIRRAFFLGDHSARIYNP